MNTTTIKALLLQAWMMILSVMLFVSQGIIIGTVAVVLSVLCLLVLQ
jgi:hypothetical protein